MADAQASILQEICPRLPCLSRRWRCPELRGLRPWHTIQAGVALKPVGYGARAQVVGVAQAKPVKPEPTTGAMVAAVNAPRDLGGQVTSVKFASVANTCRLSILPDADAVTSVVIGSAKDCATDGGHTYVFADFPHRDPCHFANRVGEIPRHGRGEEPTSDCGGVLAAVSESCQVDISGDESGKGCLGVPGTAAHHPRKKRRPGPNLSAKEGSRWLPGIDCQSSDRDVTVDDHGKTWRMRDGELELDSSDTSTPIPADIEDSAIISGKAVGVVVVRRRRRRRRPELAGNDCLQSIATAAADARAASGNYADPEEERHTSRSVGMEWEAGQGGGFCDAEVKSTGLRTGGGEDGSGKSNLLVALPQKDQSFVYSPFQVRGLRQDEDRGCFGNNSAKSQTKTSWQFQTCALIGSRTWRESSPDTISTIDFERSGDLFATGGIARKIRVYSLSRVLAGQRRGCQTVSDSEGNEDEEQEKEGILSRRKREKDGRPIDSNDGRESEREWGVDSHCADSSSGGLSSQGPCEMLSVCTPAKLSSLKWHPDYNSTVIATADYDGVITDWDINRGVAVTERQSGQRVWSIDFSRSVSGTSFSSLLASASDDGLLRLWTCNSESPTQTIHLPSALPVCSVEFSPIPYILGASSADSNVYLYDLRKPASPLQVLDAHTKAVSYMKFMGAASLVSASIDGSVKLWDLPGQVTGSTSSHDHLATGLACTDSEQNTQVASGASKSTPIPTTLPGRASVRTSYNSHRNMKNFVGLSAHADSGLFACGSENNEVVVYHSSHSEAVWVTSFDRQRAPPHLHLQTGLAEMNSLQTVPPVSWDASKGHFVSAVCWSPKSDSPDAENSTLVAANSQGHIRVILVA